MKFSLVNKISLFASIAFGISVQTVLAQAPQGLNYQAVARNSSGAILTTQAVSLRLTITDVAGTAIYYKETQSATTDQFGLFTLKVGTGTLVGGSPAFSSISWGTITPYLKVEMDPAGGAAYVDMGTSQLLSVPFALFAASGTQGTPGTNGTNGATWITGSGSPSSGSGALNDLYLDTSTGDYYKKTSASIWTLQGNLTGASGSANINGTANRIIKFNSPTTGVNSSIYDNGAGVGIGTLNPSAFLEVIGSTPGTTVAFSNPNASGVGLIAIDTANDVNGFGTGIIGSTKQTSGWGIAGINSSANGSGVLGLGNNFSGYTFPVNGAGGAFYGTGVGAYGFASDANGYGVQGKATNTSSAYGVVGVANNVQGIGPGNGGGAGGGFTGYNYGVSGAQTNGNPNVQTAGGLFIGAYNAGCACNPQTLVEAYSTGNTHYKIWGTPTGAVSTTIDDLNGNTVTLHAPETPEFYFQDFGQGKLVNGVTHINMDPVFAKGVTVSENHPLRVFVQLEGNCNGVYVTNKTATGFDVVELNGGSSNVSFQWSVTCNVADVTIGNRVSHFADLRFEPGPTSQLKELPSGTSTTGPKLIGVRK